jgi:hypothetical protein
VLSLIRLRFRHLGCCVSVLFARCSAFAARSLGACQENRPKDTRISALPRDTPGTTPFPHRRRTSPSAALVSGANRIIPADTIKPFPTMLRDEPSHSSPTCARLSTLAYNPDPEGNAKPPLLRPLEIPKDIPRWQSRKKNCNPENMLESDVAASQLWR